MINFIASKINSFSHSQREKLSDMFHQRNIFRYKNYFSKIRKSLPENNKVQVTLC